MQIFGYFAYNMETIQEKKSRFARERKRQKKLFSRLYGMENTICTESEERGQQLNTLIRIQLASDWQMIPKKKMQQSSNMRERASKSYEMRQQMKILQDVEQREQRVSLINV